jgi:FtsZ-binding cell division protein ZapB
MKLIKTFKEFINEGAYIDKKSGMVILSRKNLSGDDENYNDEVLKTVYPDKDVAYMKTIFYGLSGEHYDTKNRDHIARTKYTMDLLKKGNIKDRKKALDEFIKPMCDTIRKATSVLNYVIVLGSRQLLAEEMGRAFERNFFKEGETDILSKIKKPNTPKLIVLKKIEYPDPTDIIDWNQLYSALESEPQGKSLQMIIAFIKQMIDTDKTSQLMIRKVTNLFNKNASKEDKVKASKKLKDLIKDMRYKQHNKHHWNYDPNSIIYWKRDSFPLIISKSGAMLGNITKFFNKKYDTSTLEFMEAIQRCSLYNESMLMVDDNMHSRIDMKNMMNFVINKGNEYRSNTEGKLSNANWKNKVFGYALYRIGVESDELKQLKIKMRKEKDEDIKKEYKETISSLEDLPKGKMTGKKAASNIADFEKYLVGKKIPVLKGETNKVEMTYPDFNKNLGKYVEPRLDYLD